MSLLTLDMLAFDLVLFFLVRETKLARHEVRIDAGLAHQEFKPLLLELVLLLFIFLLPDLVLQLQSPVDNLLLLPLLLPPV